MAWLMECGFKKEDRGSDVIFVVKVKLDPDSGDNENGDNIDFIRVPHYVRDILKYIYGEEQPEKYKPEGQH